MYDFAGGGVLDERARRNRQHKVGGVGAVEFLPGSVSAVLCHEAVLETVGKQGVGIPIHAEHDVAAVAAVAAGGAAVRDVLLPVEGDGTVAAVACLYVYLDVIKEIHSLLPSFPGRRT